METRKRWFVFAVCIVAVVVGSFVPTGAAPSPAAEAHAASDGLWHAATYAVLAGTGFYAAEHERWLVVGVGVFFLGAVIEVGQAFVTYRTASVADTAANGAGVAVALALAEARRLTV